MTRPVRPDPDTDPPARTVVRRLARIGISGFDIPRNQGVGPRGYRTVDVDRKGRMLLTPPRRRSYRIATTDHRWRAPAGAVLGILAAVRSLDRLDGRNSLIHPNREGDPR